MGGKSVMKERTGRRSKEQYDNDYTQIRGWKNYQ